MNSRTSAMEPTTLACGEVGSPHSRSSSYACDSRSMSKPSRAPMPCTTMCSGRSAVTLGSFWRSEPAAALRGLANAGLPPSTSRAFSSSKRSMGMNTSPRISTSSGIRSPRSRSGTSATVRMLGVMSSPVRPSPRVAARVSLPRSYVRLTASPSTFSSHRKWWGTSPSSRAIRSAQPSSSASSKTLSSDSIRSRCSTEVNSVSYSPATF